VSLTTLEDVFLRIGE
jgi:ATP-binding cassette subfamily A (ABC1) protein 3